MARPRSEPTDSGGSAAGAPPFPALDDARAVELLELMLASRHGDLREQSLMRQGQGWFHIPAMGHEATAAAAWHLRPDDYCFPMYRDRAFVLARGMTTRELAREFFAKRTGPSGGRQLPSHFSQRELNIWSHPSPSAAHLLPACGAAWSIKLRGGDQVVVVHTGDAASRQGDFYEAVCFAREHRLPILIMVEDNGLGISTRTREVNALALEVFDDRHWTRIDGRDVWRFHQQYGQLVAGLRRGQGPALVWCEVDRIGSHTSSDDQRQYRSADELDAVRRHDPLENFQRALIARNILAEEEIERLDARIRDEVRDEYQRAQREENPAAGDFHQHVFAAPAASSPPPLTIGGPPTIADAVSAVFRAALESDPRVLLFGEDIEDPKGGVFKLTRQLSSDFPGRVVNSPLAESTIVGLASGAASCGLRPVFELQFIDFAATAWNQIVTNLATLRWRSNGRWTSPCVIYAPYGGYLPGGAIWHSQANESALAHFPGLCIAIPSTPQDAAGLFWTAMHGEDPVFVLLPKHLLRKRFQPVEAVQPVPLGKAAIVRPGSDVTLVAWGNTVEIAEQAAAEMAPSVDVEIIDLRTIVPWDRAAVIASVAKTGRLVVVQEDTENCSVGQMVVTSTLHAGEAWSQLLAAPQLVSKPNVPVGLHPNLEFGALPSAADVVQAIERVIGGSRPQRPAATAIASHGHGTRVPDPRGGRAPAESPAEPPAQPAASPRDVAIPVPHLGEGIYSGRVVELLKRAGDTVQQDEAICEIESEKATMTIESSHDGQLAVWQVAEGETVEVGQTIALVRAAQGAGQEREAFQQPTVAAAQHSPTASAPTPPAPLAASEPADELGAETPAARSRSTNTVALTRAVQVPTAAVANKVTWQTVQDACRRMIINGQPCSPTAMIAWCLTQACHTEAGRRFISNFAGGDCGSAFDLGIAVSLPPDELTTAVIDRAGELHWLDFHAAYRNAVEAARRGELQDRRNVPIQLSTLGGHQIETAHPLVVPPAIATFFVGQAHWELVDREGQPVPAQVASMIMSFDHRRVNGVGAASLLGAVRDQIASASTLDGDLPQPVIRIGHVA